MHAETIINYKKNAWQDSRMVEWYASRMSDSSGPNRLKNYLETHLISNWVTGRKILDVGIGTGRASEKLIANTMEVTGIDSSPEMIKSCRSKFGDKIILDVGAADSLPYKSQSFDTVVSLNLMTHLPHWEQVVLEWCRVARPNGRIIFDVYSKDHAELASRKFGFSYLQSISNYQQSDPTKFNLFLARDELRNFCHKNNISVKAIIPFGATLGGDYNLLLKKSISEARQFRRLQTHLTENARHYDFLLFLEREIVSKCHNAFSAKMMVVLENHANDGRTEWNRQNLKNTLNSRIFNQELRLFLKESVNLKYFAYLLSGVVTTGYENVFSEIFPNQNFVNIPKLLKQINEEEDLVAMLANLRSIKSGGSLPSIADAVEYNLVNYLISS